MGTGHSCIRQLAIVACTASAFTTSTAAFAADETVPTGSLPPVTGLSATVTSLLDTTLPSADQLPAVPPPTSRISGVILDTTLPRACSIVDEISQGIAPLVNPNCKALLDTVSGVAQQLTNNLALVTSGVIHDVITATLDGGVQPEPSGLAPLAAGSPGLTSSMFMVSGYKALSHEGFSSSSQLGSSKTPGFDEQDYGLTIGTRFDGSKFFDAPPQSVTLGIIANYTHTDIDIGASPFAPGVSKSGSAKVDTFSAGGYGLVTDGRKYGLLTVVASFGSPETESTAVLPSNASFHNYGIAASTVTGIILPVGDSKLDLRGGLDYVYATADDYADSNGFKFTDSRLDQLSGSISARLFRIIRQDDYTFRPFVQTGVNQRFLNNNELRIDGVKFSFEDADTSVFARAGVDFDVGGSTQAYVAVRGDASEDLRAITAQVGVTFKLD